MLIFRVSQNNPQNYTLKYILRLPKLGTIRNKNVIIMSKRRHDVI